MSLIIDEIDIVENDLGYIRIIAFLILNFRIKIYSWIVIGFYFWGFVFVKFFYRVVGFRERVKKG